MRYLLKEDVSAEILLERAAKAAFLVVESSVAESRIEDIRVGLYVALRKELAGGIVCKPECGLLACCKSPGEEPPFRPAER